MVNDYRWFPMLVRAIGVMGLMMSVPSLLTGILQVLTSYRGFVSQVPLDFLWWSLPGIAQAAISMYLVFGAPKFVAFCLRQVRGRCHHCDYDLRNTPGETCPECGTLRTDRPAQSEVQPERSSGGTPIGDQASMSPPKQQR